MSTVLCEFCFDGDHADCAGGVELRCDCTCQWDDDSDYVADDLPWVED